VWGAGISKVEMNVGVLQYDPETQLQRVKIESSVAQKLSFVKVNGKYHFSDLQRIFAWNENT
jgi:hypothetical protein